MTEDQKNLVAWSKKRKAKQCPHCKNMVERNTGCPHMACMCGNSFCYNCGKDYSYGNDHSKCYENWA